MFCDTNSYRKRRASEILDAHGENEISVHGHETATGTSDAQGEVSEAVSPLLQEDIQKTQASINEFLEGLLPPKDAPPAILHQAMHRTSLSAGKRFRPLLTVLIARAAGIEGDDVFKLACTSEFVHAASLILDDLPCMDDALTRRNEPCTHIFYDESTAILTATALLNYAYGIISRLDDFDDRAKVRLSRLLSNAVGSNGLIAGQILDLQNTSKATSVENVEHLNALKTGALFDYAVASAAVIAGLSDEQEGHLMAFSHQLGLAFQLLDDLKDRLMNEEQAQKDVNQDINKITILRLTDDKQAKEMVASYITKAKSCLQKAGLTDAKTLVALLDMQFSFLNE